MNKYQVSQEKLVFITKDISRSHNAKIKFLKKRFENVPQLSVLATLAGIKTGVGTTLCKVETHATLYHAASGDACKSKWKRGAKAQDGSVSQNTDTSQFKSCINRSRNPIAKV